MADLAAFEPAPYLQRLGIDALTCDTEGLARVQTAHVQALPFSNFEAYLGTVCPLDVAGIAAKMLNDNRGGYCFEHNLLFEAALIDAGFQPERLMARVRMGASVGGMRSHLALQVKIGDVLWLADTGFGGPGPNRPLRLETGIEQDDAYGRYRLIRDDATGETVLERRKDDGTWFALYSFIEERVQDDDIAAANVLCATWDEHPVYRHLMLSRRTANGHVGVRDTNVTTRGFGTLDGLTTFASRDELAELVRNLIAIEASDTEIDRAAAKLKLATVSADKNTAKTSVESERVAEHVNG